MIPLLTAAAAMWLAWLIGKEVRERHDERTVEAEQEETRAVIRLVGQHHPSEPEEYESIDDPVYMLVHEVSRQNQALM